VIDPALTGLAGVCCLAVGMRGAMLMRTPPSLERHQLNTEPSEPHGRSGPIRRLVNLLGSRLGPRLVASMNPARRRAITRRLDLAGRPAGMNLQRYGEVKAAMLTFGVLIAVLLGIAGLWLESVLWLILSFLGLDMWLARGSRRRQAALERDLPDLIDILAITVRAGTGYRQALRRVASELTGPAAEEILATLRQMDLGATRREAFEALRERNESGTLDNFVAAQLQAEELGVPLADALGNIAADTRRLAAQNARRRAQRAAPRITLTVIALLLPATLILIVTGMFVGSGVNFSHLLGG
jgi:tight adherence protein C